MEPNFSGWDISGNASCQKKYQWWGVLMTDIVNQGDAHPTGGQKPVRMGTNQMMAAQAKLSNPNIEPGFIRE